MRDGHHWKAQLKDSVKNKTISQLEELLDEKHKELLKHEYSVRGDGHNTERYGYTNKNKFRISEIRKEIAFINTKISELRNKARGKKK